MKISDIIPLKNIFLDINATSKKALFKLISKKISIRFKIDQNEILDNLNQREKLGSTGIGNGIAIPHSKIKGIK
ncbi:MAG: hypothetical protein CMP25_02230, partial [Rickettsiales bacterium]|nr:hypothetical protein [Rickettsiales bacterium]